MKKITFVILHLNYGGIESFVTTLANLLSNEYEIEIVSTYDIGSICYELNPKIKVTYLTNTISNRHEFMSALKNFKLITCFKEGVKSLKILTAKRNKMISYLKQMDTDIVITTRAFHNKLVGKYVKDNVLKIATDHNHHNNSKKYINELISSVKGFDYLITVSKALEKDYAPLLDGTKTKCKCIYTGVNTNYSKANLNSKDLVWVGRLSHEKAPLVLLNVFHEVLKKQDARLHIIGDGVEKYFVQERIEEYLMEDRVILHGFQNKEYIDKILDQSSIYINTSETESFGIVIVEAFSHGLPALAFKKASGATEIIDDGKNGYIINNDIFEMALRIVELLENKNLRKVLGDRAYEKAKEFSYDKMKKEWLKVLERK